MTAYPFDIIAIGRKRIRCNAICPGATTTNIAESMPEDRLDPIGAKRTGEFAELAPAYLESTDIAALTLFLVSDEARYINGAIVPDDGGGALPNWALRGGSMKSAIMFIYHVGISGYPVD